MGKRRKIKVLFIVALVIAIIGMTLGFAAFSTTLNISSSATVTPNSADFNIKIFGFKTAASITEFFNAWNSGNGTFIESCLIEGESAYSANEGVLATNAIIDNSTYTLSNMNITFDSLNKAIQYWFVLINDGKYTAYLDWDSITYNYNCEIGADVNTNLGSAACSSIKYNLAIVDSTGTKLNAFFPGEVAFVRLYVTYGADGNGTLPDGTIAIKVDNMKIPFTTVSTN